MKALALVLVAFAAALAAAKPTVYLIRHGEKPADDKERGLSEQGKRRAECLRHVFGISSGYNISHIMAQAYFEDGRRIRPYDTVAPLAETLGLEVDVSCDRDDASCVRDVVEEYTGGGNILICWEHKRLRSIVKEMGAQGKVKKYPRDAFDLIWTDPPPYSGIVDVTSQNCPWLSEEM